MKTTLLTILLVILSSSTRANAQDQAEYESIPEQAQTQEQDDDSLLRDLDQIEREFGSGNLEKSVLAKYENDSEVRKCKSSAESTKSACNIISPEMMMLFGGATQIGGAAMSGNSIKEKCDAASKISSLGATANTSLGGYCWMQSNACVDFCGERERKTAERYQELVPETQRNCENVTRYAAQKKRNLKDPVVRKQLIELKKICFSYKVDRDSTKKANVDFQRNAGYCMEQKTKSYPMLIQAVANAGIAAASAACASKAGESSIAAFCARAENAGSASCGGVANCSDPLRARQDPSCVCTNPTAMATNPICAGYGGSGATAGVGGSALSGGGSSSLSSLSPDGLTNKDFKGVAVKPTESQNPGVPNGGGGGQMGAGNNPGSLNPEEGGGHAADYKTDLDQGYQRSRGGGEGGGSMFGGYRGSGGGSEYGSSGKSKSSFNLSKYLPWTQKGPAREIASRQLRSEGVTAAEGPSIWEKVTTRMRALKTNLQ